MPEGPEIRREADELAAVLQGRIAREVILTPPRLAGRERDLRGKRVKRVRAHGKAMLIEFAGGPTLYSHNQLYGRWYAMQHGERPKTGRTLRVAIETDRGAALLYSASVLALLDARGVREHPYLSKLGPDLLDPELKASAVSRRLAEPAFRKRTLAALLLDQGFIAGNGNYLRSEALFDARLDWRLRPMDLTTMQRNRLARSILAIGKRAYETDGYTNPAKRIAALKKLGQRRGLRFAVFGREGKPCYECGTTIVREVAGSRRIYRCARCQPRKSAD